MGSYADSDSDSCLTSLGGCLLWLIWVFAGGICHCWFCHAKTRPIVKVCTRYWWRHQSMYNRKYIDDRLTAPPTQTAHLDPPAAPPPSAPPTARHTIRNRIGPNTEPQGTEEITSRIPRHQEPPPVTDPQGKHGSRILRFIWFHTGRAPKGARRDRLHQSPPKNRAAPNQLACLHLYSLQGPYQHG